MELLPPDREQLATKADILDLKTELRADVAELKTDLKADLAELKTELKADVAELRSEFAELRSEFAELRTELRADVAELRSEFAELRTELKADIAELRTDVSLLIGRMDRMESLMVKFDERLWEFHEALRSQTRTYVTATVSSMMGVGGLAFAAAAFI
jgi:chromosome segregation ATPase